MRGRNERLHQSLAGQRADNQFLSIRVFLRRREQSYSVDIRLLNDHVSKKEPCAVNSGGFVARKRPRNPQRIQAERSFGTGQSWFSSRQGHNEVCDGRREHPLEIWRSKRNRLGKGTTKEHWIQGNPDTRIRSHCWRQSLVFQRTSHVVSLIPKTLLCAL